MRFVLLALAAPAAVLGRGGKGCEGAGGCGQPLVNPCIVRLC
jgi:hypothetical protein